ncbi:MAG: DnaA regulatory inactivator Hda [Gammaproteobacteria bacterium]|nr:DnaA regulatory inactivator Hda [Gammaproteobacteria bacterium]NNM20368.1 DnaA regulatory inactivator Hda [Gammaproteobacteria bacterium]
MDQLTLDVRLPDQARFNNFVTGSNTEAVAAVTAHARNRDVPLLWLRGPSAVGKSHLLLAACHSVTADGGRAAFLSASEASRLAPQDVITWGRCNLVAVDDIDGLAGHADWEAALFGLFNELRDHGNALLAASQLGPRSIDFSLRDLASRMASGPVYRLLALSDDQRLAALRVRAHERGFELPDETGHYLMSRYPRDLSSLFAVLDRLDHASLQAQRRVTIPFVKDVLEKSEDIQN